VERPLIAEGSFINHQALAVAAAARAAGSKARAEHSRSMARAASIRHMATHQARHGLAVIGDLQPVPGGQVAQPPGWQQLCITLQGGGRARCSQRTRLSDTQACLLMLAV